MRVLVTGATGFVGKAVTRRLCDSGHYVRACVRALPADASLRATEFVEVGDLTGEVLWDDALDGIDAVVYLAARVHRLADKGGEAEYTAVNATAAARLAAAAADCGVGRFVYLSSIKVNGERTTGVPFADCSAAPEDAYARSKLLGERQLTELARTGRMVVTVLRPPLVYGPGVRANFLRLMKAAELSARVPLPLGGIHNARSLIFVDNLADAVALAAAPEAPGGCYVISDIAPLSTPEMVRLLARGLGARARLIPIPPAALRVVGLISRRREVISRLLDSLVVDPTRFMQSHGWRPPHSTQEGFAATTAWYRQAQMRRTS